MQVLGVCHNFSGRGALSAGPPNVNLGPPNISETARAKKLKYKNTIRCGKVLASGTNIFPLGASRGVKPLM